MPEFDNNRLELAEAVRRGIALENELTRPQARAYVRCLQATWNVDKIQWSDDESNTQMHDAMRLFQAADIFEEIEGINTKKAIDCYRRAAELLEWLARAEDSVTQVAPTAILAAGAYQLAGLPAMAAGLLRQAHLPGAGERVYAAFLTADFDKTIELAMEFWRQNPQWTRIDAPERFFDAEEDQDPNRVIIYLIVELIRVIGLLSDCLRRGDDQRYAIAFEKLRKIERIATRSFGDLSSLLVSLLRRIAERYNSSSIYEPLNRLSAGRSEARQRKMRLFARGQYSRARGILWTSQMHGLERLIADTSFALCTPTGSGKTLVANLAIIRDLLLRAEEGSAPLALYIVPSRALAGEVEAKLRPELGGEFVVTGLYGGADWGVTDSWLTAQEPTVLIATVEKADALMRYLGPMLIRRLALLIVDEAHQVVPDNNSKLYASFAEHANRSLRLESLISRILSYRPDVSRIALTAVAGGASTPVARWVERRGDASPVGVNYRSTRQVIGVLESTPGQSGRMFLDLMNGKFLYLRDQADLVFLPLRIPVMPLLPAAVRNSLNRFNSLSVLWTALHLVEEKQRILISIAQEPEKTMRWYKEAFELDAWKDIPAFEIENEDAQARFDEARRTCVDYCGEESFEVALLDRGIATSHGQMPQRLRRLMVEMIERRICPITVATATLTEGVNLPFDLIFLTSLKRRSWDDVNNVPDDVPISTAEFRNLAGRAGRPGIGKGLEGLTIVALPIANSSTAAGSQQIQNRQRRDLRAEYNALRDLLVIEEGEVDKSDSPLALLLDGLQRSVQQNLGLNVDQFLDWLETISPANISPQVGIGSAEPRARLADMVDELDAVLLAAVEEMNRIDEGHFDAAALEGRLSELWRSTFSAVAAQQEEWMEQAIIRRGNGVYNTVYPDAAERQRLYQFGYSPAVGRQFDVMSAGIRLLLADASRYGELNQAERYAYFFAIGELLRGHRGYGFRARNTVTDQQLLENWGQVLQWWLHIDGAPAPDPEQLRAWQRFVADNLEFRLGVAIGAVAAQAWSAGADDPLAVPSLENWRETAQLPWFAFWARELLRWGTHEPFVAYAMSQGLAKTRGEGMVLHQEFSDWLGRVQPAATAEDRIDPRMFNIWRSSLENAAEVPRNPVLERVRLTGTDGRQGSYNVCPVRIGADVVWFDAAGFELARSDGGGEPYRSEWLKNDYRLSRRENVATVSRVFRATKE